MQPDPQELDVDALMREIRAEIAGRAGVAGRAQSGPGPPGFIAGARDDVEVGSGALPRFAESEPGLPRKTEYSVREFLDYHDEAFVRAAYRGVLAREPDPEGGRRFLEKLRSAEFAKVDVLGRMRYSREGRAAGVRITGLLLPFALRTMCRVPVLGHLVEIILDMFRLPQLVRRYQRLEGAVFRQRSELRHGVNAAVADIERALQRSEQAVAASRTAAEQQTRAVEAKLERAAASARESAQNQLRALEAKLGEAALAARDSAAQQLRSFEAKLGEVALAARDSAAQQLRSLEAKSDRTEVAALASRLDNEIRAQAAQWELARAAGEKLEALRGVVSRLEQWSAGQPTGDALRESMAIAAAAQAHAARIAADLATLGTEAGRISERQAALDQQLLTHRQDLLEQERRLRVLLEAPAKSPPGKAESTRETVALQELDHIYDRFYTSFEDTFRGTYEDIKGRLAIYVPYVVGAGAGTPHAPVLDIGCGRGEWLQLLKDGSLAARGVDFNRSSVERCHGLGLDVTMADALEYLRAQKAESIGAVTAFHIAEHLPFPQILQLFDEVRRVLRPEGMFIMETPNPENLIVGACTFWNDPTHLQPLPPDPMRFVMENRGFTRVEILRLHPNTAITRPEDTEDSSLKAIADRLYGPQDYSLIGYAS